MASPSDGAGSRSLLFLALAPSPASWWPASRSRPSGWSGLTAKRGAENFQSLPAELSVPPLKQRSRLLAADGTVIATFYSQNRVYVPMDKISPVMQDAIVAIEDARFYEHNGIDVRGTLRALIANTQAGEVTQGGSTITQQYVKNVLAATATPTKENGRRPPRTPSRRKLRELRLRARARRSSGARSGSSRATSTSPTSGRRRTASRLPRSATSPFRPPDLNAGQAATLAGIVKYPSLYDPLVNPQESEERRNFVLQRMADENMISQRRPTSSRSSR